MLPPEVQDVVMRCLRKDPDQRFQSMGDVKNALEQIYFASRSGIMQLSSGRLEAPGAAKAMPSIAVLPFLNLSSDKENEYFSDGLAEEIINALTRLENLRVTARTSAFAFRGAQQDIRQIGETLQCGQRARRQRAQIRQPRAYQRAADRCGGGQQSLVGTL